MTRLRLALTCVLLSSALVCSAAEPAKSGKVDVGQKAPAFQIKDATGKMVDLAKLTEKGPVLVRLTCGCSGCDKELAYFQKIHDAYKDQGLQSLLIFREPDAKMVKYAKDKKLNMLYAVDPKGASWKVFQTKAMPANFLIEKGGKIVAVATGCDPSGILANKVSQGAAKTLGKKAVDVKKEVEKTKSKK
ncbi:MAG TPA: redoxin domain-containing protein [Gemmataceae bacterium]|nr:redoxin domain-containing protein [Gemmataceae bacterium]